MEADHGQSTPSGPVLTVTILFLLVVGIGCDAPVAHRFVVDGDVMLGAIFSMHKASLSCFYLFACMDMYPTVLNVCELHGLCRFDVHIGNETPFVS